MIIIKLEKVLLIGGSPCSGKSTISNYLGEKYGYQIIHTDDYMGKHIEEANKEEHPAMYNWKVNKWHDLFSRDVDTLLNEEIKFYEEEFELLRRDILKDINKSKVIIEGAALMPNLINNMFENQQIIYVIPSKEFQLDKYSERAWAKDIVKDAIDPIKAYNNWMERDIEFAKFISKSAKECNYEILLVDGKNSIEENIKNVINYFELDS